MNLTKKNKEKILKIYDTWMHSYLNGDVATYDKYLDKHYHFIGSTDNEEFLTKKDTTNFFKATADQLAGKCDLRNETKIIEKFEGLVFVTHLFDAWFLNGKDWSYYGRFRFSSILKKNNEGWRFIYQHFSTTDSKTDEGETIGFDKVNVENQELREAIQRRTIELEVKNRELEIEGALEKVRSRTMAMQHSDELQETSFLLDEQVRALGIETWGCAFNIYGENDSTEWFGNEAGVLPTYCVPRKGIFKKYYQKGQQGESLYIQEFSGEDCVAHYEYMSSLPVIGDVLKNLKKTNNGFPTYQIDHVVYFKFGYLLFITKEPVLDAHDIFKRFAKVFEQTYTRFLDLQKAEAQAREAQIEMALEKVRSRSLSMHTTDELQEVVAVVAEKLKDLGVIFDAGGVILCTYFPDNKNVMHWIAADDFSYSGSYFVPYFENPIFDNAWESKIRGDTYYSEGFSVEDKNYFFEYAFEHSDYKYFPDEFKQHALQAEQHRLTAAWSKNSAIIIPSFTGAVPSDSDGKILKRFAKVFEQAYIRFMDLQKAEEQTRAAQINLAVERVRAKALAMHKSEEIIEVVAKLKDEVMALDIPDVIAATIFLNEGTDKVRMWDLATLEKDSNGYQMPFDITFKLKKRDPNLYVKRVWENPEDYFVDVQNEKDLKRIVAWFRENNQDDIANEVEQHTNSTNLKQLYHAVKKLNNGKLAIDLLNPPSDEMETILTKMGAAFDLAYQRFEDLQNAEKQAKEAQIEVALERVRSRSMAMHQSEELLEVITVVSEQLTELDIKFTHVSFAYDDSSQDYTFWTSAKGQPEPMHFKTPFLDLAVFNNLRQAQNQSLPFFTDIISKKDHIKWHKHLLKHGGSEFFSEKDNAYIMSRGMARSMAINPKIALIVGNYASIPYSEEENKIIERFGQVFEQSYTRFLDLQKAETQAKEAQIEASLEKVRTVALSLQKSDDMLDIAQVLFEQLQVLGFDHMRNAIIDVHIDDDSFIDYDYSDNMQGTVTKMRYSDDPSLEEQFRQVVASKDNLFELILEGQELQNLIDMRIKNGEAEDTRLRDTEQLSYNMYSFGNGAIGISNFGLLSSDEKAILKRFRNVFTFAYNRYSELAQREAQARKTQIDVALEKVRNRTMAMQHSDELPLAANNLFLQVQDLGIPAWSAGYCIWENNDKKSAWCSMSSEGEIQKGFSLPTIGEGYNFDTPLKNKEPFHVAELGGEALVKHYDFMKTLPIIGDVLEDFDSKGIVLPTFQIFHVVYFSHGYLMFITYEDVTSEWDIFKRFGKIFDQTYTRFLDLQKAEAQAREARIEAALERVRNAALSLKKSDDMLDIAKELYIQLLGLGFSNIRNAIIDIHNDEDETFMDYDYSHDMSGTVTKMSYYDDPIIIEQVRQIESSHDAFFELILEGQTLQDLIDVRRNNGEADDERLMNIDQLSYNLYSFGNGAIGISNFGILNAEEKEILKRFTTVFTFAYQRFLDLQEKEIQAKKLAKEKQRLEETLADLQETQEQLIQSEKMASLGELTAGIAHEIQNPLNFVNNFSEVSQELLEEMLEELENGDTEEVKAIINDITQNLEKINHHGKRADGIVKGMLQHSRATGDKKEPTDLNVLADEYLRLAYHGLRAKDKSFNATLETNFAKNLKKVDIIPQDIGRVILNLLTNAFYVVNEKKKEGISDYKPTVSIITKNVSNAVEVIVIDNGGGMPESVKEKIFQPFFTTKPTGQGTGLGLSLSYDIVTKGHGGNLQVESKEGYGTTFTITIPIKTN